MQVIINKLPIFADMQLEISKHFTCDFCTKVSALKERNNYRFCKNCEERPEVITKEKLKQYYLEAMAEHCSEEMKRKNALGWKLSWVHSNFKIKYFFMEKRTMHEKGLDIASLPDFIADQGFLNWEGKDFWQELTNSVNKSKKITSWTTTLAVYNIRRALSEYKDFADNVAASIKLRRELRNDYYDYVRENISCGGVSAVLRDYEAQDCFEGGFLEDSE